jgi:hypothetical protein
MLIKHANLCLSFLCAIKNTKMAFVATRRVLFSYWKFPGDDVIGGDSCAGGPIVFAESAAHLVSISSAVARVLGALSAADAGDVLSQNALQITLTVFIRALALTPSSQVTWSFRASVCFYFYVLSTRKLADKVIEHENKFANTCIFESVNNLRSCEIKSVLPIYKI